MELAGHRVTDGQPVFFILGPCALESYDIAQRVADVVSQLRLRHKSLFIYKGSYAKANRTSGNSYRGPGLENGLKILKAIKKDFDLPILSDVHETSEVLEASKVLDVIQIPAFLSRQTNLIEACSSTGCPIMLKKGQFMSPSDAIEAVQKARAAATAATKSAENVMVCERGSSFGYGDVIVDFRGIHAMKAANFPVVFDASHTARLHEGNVRYGGEALTPVLARAAIAAGASGVFIETHPTPENALSDSKTQFPLKKLPELIDRLFDLAYDLRNVIY